VEREQIRRKMGRKKQGNKQEKGKNNERMKEKQKELRNKMLQSCDNQGNLTICFYLLLCCFKRAMVYVSSLSNTTEVL
jgi:hypothetical protein